MDGLHDIPILSEREFRGDLNESRWRGADNAAKGAAGDIAVDRSGAIELRVIEHIERFHAKLQRSGTGQSQVLDHAQVNVFDSRTVEEAPRRVAALTERRQAEARR